MGKVSAETSDQTVSIEPFDYSKVVFTIGSEEAKKGGRLRFDMSGDPAHLNPLTSKDSYELTVNQLIMGTLITYDIDNDEPLPYIADGWKIDVLPDSRQTFTFHINPDACFSDGHAITADDVIFSYRVFFDDDYPTAHNRPYYSSISKAEKLDDLTVRFETIDTYYLNFSMLGSLQILPRHLYEPYMVAKYKEKKENVTPNLSLHPVGCGPYTFSEWIRGKHILLQRDWKWWGNRLPHFSNCYNFDIIQIKIIKDPKIAFEHFKRGDIDYYVFTASQWVRETDTDAFRSGKLRKIEIHNKVPGGYTFIGWNLINPELSNLAKMEFVPHSLFGSAKVRKAMTHLIDRELYVEKYRYGYSMRCTSPFGNRSDYSDPSIKPYNFDPDLALNLLKEEGWNDHDLDTILDKTVDGSKIDFIFTLLIPADSPAMEAMASIIREDLRAMGIIMNIKTVEWNSFQKLTDDKTFDAFTMGWTGTIHPDPRGLWHSSSAAPGGNNLVTYINPEVDRLCDEGVKTLDKEQRFDMFRQIHRILHEEQPYTFLTEPLCDLMGVNSRIHIMYNPRTGEPTFDYGTGAIQYWWIEEPENNEGKATRQ
ncbi:hypothetical protein JW979_08425 [bacterium]|nr:hypothetical protein [candidate division CSSED10-310 bacterium]